MKKLIMMIAALAIAGSAMAQTALPDDAELRKAIVGKYTSKSTESMGGGARLTTESTETFNEDGTYSEESSVIFRASGSDEFGGRISVYVEMLTTEAGTYSIDSAVINFVIDPYSINGEVVSQGDSDYDSQAADQLMQLIDMQRAYMLDPANAEELADMFKLPIFSINEKQMVTQDANTKKKTVHKRVKE